VIVKETQPFWNADRRKLVLGAVTLAYLTIVAFSLFTVTNMTTVGLILVYKCVGIAIGTNIVLIVPITLAKMYGKGLLTLAELSEEKLSIIENVWLQY